MFEGEDEKGRPIGPRIVAELWAWVVTEPDGGEGVPAIRTGEGWLPAMGGDRARIESLRDLIVATTAGMPLKLVRFTGAEVVEVVRPERAHS
jgi:hypothetical protein